MDRSAARKIVSLTRIAAWQQRSRKERVSFSIVTVARGAAALGNGASRSMAVALWLALRSPRFDGGEAVCFVRAAELDPFRTGFHYAVEKDAFRIRFDPARQILAKMWCVHETGFQDGGSGRHRLTRSSRQG